MRMVSVSMLIACALLPTHAAAQTHQVSGLFVQAGGFASIELLPHGTVTFEGLGPAAPGGSPLGRRADVVPGGGFAVGMFVRPSVAFAVETSLQGGIDSNYEPAQAVASLTVDGGGLTQSTGPTITSSSTGHHQDIYVTAGWRPGRTDGRVRLAFIGGVVVRRNQQTTSQSLSYEAVIPTIVNGRLVSVPSIETQSITSDSVVYESGLVVGVDAEVALNSHLTLVPQLRVVPASAALALRPGIHLRWHP